MRFVAVKSEAQQARGMQYRTRDLLVHQRTQARNALRSHLAEFGVVAPQEPVGLRVCGGGSGSGIGAARGGSGVGRGFSGANRRPQGEDSGS